MEYEVRYYFNTSKLDELLNVLGKIKKLKKSYRNYEKTIQYDHSSNGISFYSKEIDGRFRVRITKNDKESMAKISFKRRLTNTFETSVNKEEEIEVNINPNDYDNLLNLLENVLKMKLIESYERYRTTFTNNDIEISLDEYPFGIALEIENKSNTLNPIDNVLNWVSKLGLNIDDAYRLSWDDKYSELCKMQNIEKYNHVLFGLPMPEVK